MLLRSAAGRNLFTERNDHAAKIQIYKRRDFVQAALDITRESGLSALTARALAARLGCSVKPVFGAFKNVEEVQKEVMVAATRMYGALSEDRYGEGPVPAV